jgi:hypothetical protein
MGMMLDLEKLTFNPVEAENAPSMFLWLVSWLSLASIMSKVSSEVSSAYCTIG